MRMQVYCGDDHVGWIRVQERNIHGKTVVLEWHTIETLSFMPGRHGDEGLRRMEPSVRQLILPLARRQMALSDLTLESLGLRGDTATHMRLMQESANMPDEGVEERVDMMTSARIWTWRVVSLTSDQHEAIFDMDWFEPADTEPDYEARMRQMASGSDYMGGFTV